MRVRWIEAGVCLALLALAGGAGAADSVEASWNAESRGSASAVGAVVAVRAPVRPWIHPKMPERVRTTLELGFDIAVDRVRNVESCNALFEALGSDGLEMLAKGLYFPVDSYWREVEVCGRCSAAGPRIGRNLAYTTVGGPSIWICRHFGRIVPEKAAAAMIHEALHHAGLTEKPHDRTAMSSIEISRVVRDACGF